MPLSECVYCVTITFPVTEQAYPSHLIQVFWQTISLLKYVSILYSSDLSPFDKNVKNYKGSTRGIDSEFKLQSCYYVNFGLVPLGKVWTPYLFSYG